MSNTFFCLQKRRGHGEHKGGITGLFISEAFSPLPTHLSSFSLYSNTILSLIPSLFLSSTHISFPLPTHLSSSYYQKILFYTYSSLVQKTNTPTLFLPPFISLLCLLHLCSKHSNTVVLGKLPSPLSLSSPFCIILTSPCLFLTQNPSFLCGIFSLTLQRSTSLRIQ